MLIAKETSHESVAGNNQTLTDNTSGTGSANEKQKDDGDANFFSVNDYGPQSRERTSNLR